MGYVKFTYCLIAYLILFSCSYKSVPYYEDDDLTKGSLVTVSEINGYKSSKVKSKEKVYAVVNKLTEGYEIKVAPKSYAAKDSKKVFYTSINKLQYFNNKQGYKMPRSEKYVYFDGYFNFVFCNYSLDDMIKSPNGKSIFILNGVPPDNIHNRTKEWDFSEKITKIYFLEN